MPTPSLSDLQAEFFKNTDQESLVVRGSAVAPALNAAIVTLAAPPAGVYEVVVIARYGTVADVIDGMDLRVQGVVITQLPVQAIANSEGESFRIFRRLSGVQNLSVNAFQAGAATSVYAAHIIATKIGEL